MKLGILFAGQGSQRVGMGKDFYDEFEDFKDVFDLLSTQQQAIAWEGPASSLSDTRNTQPIMVAFALGVYKCLAKAGLKPAMAAGLSLGEYSALSASGVFDSDTAIRLVKKRAFEMDRAATGIDCKMAAVLNLDRDLLQECCEEASSEGVVSIANYNCPGQIVIAGESAAVEKASELANLKGAKRVIELPVSGPFHTKFMEPAGVALEEIFKEMHMGDMQFPVIFNVSGKQLEDGETIGNMLVHQVSSSVHFEETIKEMLACGVDTIIEIGPGKALSGFVKKTDRSIKIYNIDCAEDMKTVIEDLKGAVYEK